MTDDWMKSPFDAMHTPLPGDELDVLGQMMEMPMPEDETESEVPPMDPATMMAQKIVEEAVKTKALSQRAQQAIAAKNDAELKNAV